MKIKTLLFGAGAGSKIYIENNLEHREFIGYVDNDKTKHDSYFNSLLIYSPLQLSSLEFDEIVITTQWSMEVKQQLVDVLNIPQEKVVQPPKNQLKKAQPFMNENGKRLGRIIIKELNNLAKQYKVPLVVDFGTLLGLVREGDIISWDDDIDFSVPVQFADEIEKILEVFVADNKNVDWNIEKIVNKNNNTACFLLKFHSSDNTLVEFTTSLCFREIKEGNAVHMPSLGMWYAPEKHFNEIETFLWQGQYIQVPAEFKQYLSFQYGDWSSPKKDMQLSDYAHLNEVEFSEIQKAGFHISDENG